MNASVCVFNVRLRSILRNSERTFEHEHFHRYHPIGWYFRKKRTRNEQPRPLAWSRGACSVIWSSSPSGRAGVRFARRAGSAVRAVWRPRGGRSAFGVGDLSSHSTPKCLVLSIVESLLRIGQFRPCSRVSHDRYSCFVIVFVFGNQKKGSSRERLSQSSVISCPKAVRRVHSWP